MLEADGEIFAGEGGIWVLLRRGGEVIEGHKLGSLHEIKKEC